MRANSRGEVYRGKLYLPNIFMQQFWLLIFILEILYVIPNN